MKDREERPHPRHWLLAAALLFLTCLVVPVVAGLT